MATINTTTITRPMRIFCRTFMCSPWSDAPSLHRLEMRLKLVEILLIAGNRVGFDLIKHRSRFEKHAPVNPCFPSEVFKHNRRTEFWKNSVIKNNAFVFHDLDEHAFVGILHAVGPVHDETPVASGSQIEFMKGVG